MPEKADAIIDTVLDANTQLNLDKQEPHKHDSKSKRMPATADETIDTASDANIEQNLDKQEPYEHDFKSKRNPATFKSRSQCFLNFLIAIPAVLFHLPIMTLLCMFFNLLPFSTSVRRQLQRNVKVYAENVGNSILGLWFNQTFYVSIDSRLTDLVKKRETEGKFPNVLTIGNHISEVDWLFMSLLAEALNFYRYTYIIMKKSISSYPFIGFLAKSFGHSFVVREASQDATKKSDDIVALNSFSNNLIGKFDESRKTHSSFLSKIIDSISSAFSKTGIISANPGANGLYYPEGTIFTEDNYKKGLEFYEKNKDNKDLPGIFKPDFVLLPKALGTAAIISNLSEKLDCICNTTMLTLPYASSTFDCLPFSDIFFCRAPAFSFCMILDYLEIPSDLKNSINKLPEGGNNFLRPRKLTDKEKVVKHKTTEWIYGVWNEKDKLVEKYVSNYNGTFNNNEEFTEFINSAFESSTESTRQCIPMKIDSPYKNIILFAPVLCLSIIFCVYFVKIEFLSKTILKKQRLVSELLK